MRFLRTASTRRLLAVLAGLLAVVAAGSAIAVAATSGGPKPPPKRLPNAIHQALAAPSVPGITARIKFTNNLISSSNLQGSDPILSGATGRVWLSSDHGMRLELQASGEGNNGQDAEVVVDPSHNSWWVYDPMSNTKYQGTLPSRGGPAPARKKEAVPTVARIQTQLNQVLAHLNVAGPTPANIAGQEAYTVKVTPKHAGGLLGAVQLGWDALRGVPLRFALYARGSTSPALELTATDISYGAVSKADLTASPPAGYKTVTIASPASKKAPAAKHKHADVSGAAAVQKHLSFKLKAPAKLVGLPRQSVELLDWAGSPAALVSYGQNLGGIAVIEQKRDKAQASAPAAGHDQRGLSLPTVSINGTSAQELGTAIGTVLRFTRNGVTYTVLGSVPPAAAEAAARAL